MDRAPACGQAVVIMTLSRRSFLQKAGQGAVAAGFLTGGLVGLRGAELKKRKMTADLVCGNLGISASQLEAIELAARHGFESVGADGAYLASLSENQAADLKSTLRNRNLVFGGAGLTVEFRQDDARFDEGMKKLPAIAAGMQRAGAARVTTWLQPGTIN